MWWLFRSIIVMSLLPMSDTTEISLLSSPVLLVGNMFSLYPTAVFDISLILQTEQDIHERSSKECSECSPFPDR